MVLGYASGKQTSNLLHKMPILAPKSDIWNKWEPWAVCKLDEKTSWIMQNIKKKH